MKIKQKKGQIVFFIIFFVILSWLMSFWDLSLDEFLGERDYWGKGGSLFYIANWPSLIFKLYPLSSTNSGSIEYNIEEGLFNPLVIVANTIGWTIIGLIVGLIISLKKPEVDISFSKLKRELFSANRDIRITISLWLFSLFVVATFGFNVSTLQVAPNIIATIQIFLMGSTLLFPIIIPLLIMESIIHLVRGKKKKDYLNLSQRVVLWCILISSISFSVIFLIVYFLRP